MNAKTALKKLRLTSQREADLRTHATDLAHPVVFIPQTKLKLRERVVEPEIAEFRGLDGVVFNTALSWTCDPRFINLLAVGNDPVIARRFTFSVGAISWTPGQGWPVYTSYCPVNGYGAQDFYRNAKQHQIVPSIQGQNYFVGCSSSAFCESAAPGQVAFAVNDYLYGDNQGYFVVTLYGWS
jgi:hypothetical protein